MTSDVPRRSIPDEPVAASPPLGELFGGRYRLGALLGVGGSASVFEATDEAAAPKADARVALKTLHPHLCARERTREAFLREARIAEDLHHPNIAEVRASGLSDVGGDTLAWIALELIRGPALADQVRAAGAMPPSEAAAVLDGVLAGLEAVHAHGLVHRDVSPRNILLTGTDPAADGSVLAKLVDFGLADATGRSTVGGDVLLAGDSAAPMVVGNAHYMSPEQARGRPVTAAGDLYQAAAVLYFLLTGRPPFPRGTAEQVLEAHLSAPPPVPSALIPPARPFDWVVTRGMAKEPEQRFADAGEFREALAAAVAALGQPVSRTLVLPIGVVPPSLVPVVPRAPEPPAAGTKAVAAAGSALAPRTRPPLDYLAATTAAEPDEDPPTRRSSPAGALAGLAAVTVAGLAVWAVLSGFAGPVAVPTASVTSGPRTAGTTAAIPLPSSTPTTPPRTTAVQVPVPELTGTLAEAKAALLAAGLRLGSVSRISSPAAAETVLGQTPAGGDRAARGSAVNLVVASGTNTVPNVAGLSVSAATAVVRSAGFEVAAENVSPSAIVIGCDPAAGSARPVGTIIQFQISETPTSPNTDGEPPTSQDPEPNHSGSPPPPSEETP